MKKKAIFLLTVLFIFLLSACSNNKVTDIIEKIDKLGEINDRTGQQLSEIEQEYSTLSDTQKAKVSNYGKYLITSKEYKSHLEIENIKNKIDSIKDISLDTNAVISEIEISYEKLNEEEKKKVDNYEKLKNIKSELAQYIKSTVEDVVRDLRMYNYNERGIKKDKLFAYYDYMSDMQKKECLALYLFYQEAPDAVESKIKSSLKNPSSYTLYNMDISSVLVYNQESDDFTGFIDITYGGTNSFGGMVKETDELWVDFSVDIKTQKIYIDKITNWGF